MAVLFTCISTHHVCLVPTETRGGIRCPRTEATDGCEPSHWHWQLKPDHPQKDIFITLKSTTLVSRNHES